MTGKRMTGNEQRNEATRRVTSNARNETLTIDKRH